MNWEGKKRRPSAAEWVAVRERLDAARALDPYQPAWAEDLARLYELRALPLPAADPLAREYLRQALAYQREALPLRPGSPYTWSNIALLKARLDEADAELDAALRHAVRLGPWEPRVQLAVADAGWRHWGRLAPQTRQILQESHARALRRQDAKLFELARRTGRLGLLCATPGVARSPLATACI